MGSATTQALAASTAALNAAKNIDLNTARELFAAARALGDSSQLSGALAMAASAPEARAGLVESVFAGYGAPTRALLATVVSQRWSSPDQMIGGIEELAIRSAGIAAGDADVDGELFEVGRTVAANPELELALGSRLGDAQAKGTLVNTLLSGSAHEATVLIATALVQQPRERRVRALLGWAQRLVADQRGRTVATVHSATALSAAQVERLQSALSGRYGERIALNIVIDPTVVGGLRVEIGSDVIDGTVSTRLGELRQQLAS